MLAGAEMAHGDGKPSSASVAGEIARTSLCGSSGVPVLASMLTSTGTTTVAIPANTALGPYYLLACADDTNVSVEDDESNNCRASAGQITVTD